MKLGKGILRINGTEIPYQNAELDLITEKVGTSSNAINEIQTAIDELANTMKCVSVSSSLSQEAIEYIINHEPKFIASIIGQDGIVIKQYEVFIK